VFDGGIRDVHDLRLRVERDAELRGIVSAVPHFSENRILFFVLGCVCVFVAFFGVRVGCMLLCSCNNGR